jgi:hypothetical protein
MTAERDSFIGSRAEVKAGVVEAEHVLIGIPRAGDQQAAAALAREGVTLEKLRRAALEAPTIRRRPAAIGAWARSTCVRCWPSPVDIPHERVLALLDAPPADCLEA